MRVQSPHIEGWVLRYVSVLLPLPQRTGSVAAEESGEMETQ